MSDPVKTIRSHGEQPRMVTEHFALDEFRQPSAYGLPGEDYPGEWIADRLIPLCQTLERIREELGAPVRILSGYRSEAYNEARRQRGHQVAQFSQHMYGRAADIQVEGHTASEVHARIARLHQEGHLPHLGGLGVYDSFVHVDVRPQKSPDKLALWDERSDAGKA